MRPVAELLPRVLRCAVLVVCVYSGTIPAKADLQIISAPGQSFVPSASAGGDSYSAIISSDGRWVLFASTANNLTAESSNSISLSQLPQKFNIYCRDRSNGVTTLASVNLFGGPANDDCTPIGLSTNGQYALFESSASDLVDDDTNGVSDVFIRDLVAGTTLLVSVATNGMSGSGASYDSVMTPDGRFVAFASAATNLVAGDSNRIPDIFVRDMQIGITAYATVGGISHYEEVMDYGGFAPVPYSNSKTPGITPDGRYVVFQSTETNLVAGLTNVGEIYVRDLIGETTHVVSTNAHAYIRGPIISYNPIISDGGQFVAFEASSNSPAATGFIFRYNFQTGSIQVVASNAVASAQDYKFGRTQTSGYYVVEIISERDYRAIPTLDMSSDGRFIAFLGKTNTGPGTTTTCVFVWDGQSGTTRLISTNLDGSVQTNSTCELPAMDDTGQFISFLSTATNLTTNVVSGDAQLYMHDLAAGTTYLVDTATNGMDSEGLLRGVQSMSGDGRFVAFDSDSPNLVANDNNQSWDVFLRDLATGTTELISVRDPGFPSQTSGPDNGSYRLSMSANGRYVAFASRAKGLVENFNGEYMGVFVRDLLNGTTSLVSTDTNGLLNGNGSSFEPVISGDGQHVAFTSFANNLDVNDGNGTSDVFVRNLISGTTTLISTNRAGGGSGNGASRAPSISFDGKYLSFFSKAGNLVFPQTGPGMENLFLRYQASGTNAALTTGGVMDAFATPDIHYVAYIDRPYSSPAYYLWDVQDGRRIYTNSSAFLISPSGQRLAYFQGQQLIIRDRIANTNLAAIPFYFAGLRTPIRFSADERFLVFATRADLVADDTSSGNLDVYLYDLLGGTNLLVSRSPISGLPANGASTSPDISADGRFIVYRSDATNLATMDGNRTQDVFLYDRQSATTVLLSASAYGSRSAAGRSGAPIFSGDGQTVMFQSFAPDLIENDFNQGMDAFFLRLQTTNPVVTGQIIYAPGADQPPTLNWIAPPGPSYRVEFKSALTDDIWQPLDGNVWVADDIGHATDVAPNPDGRFYRVVAE